MKLLTVDDLKDEERTRCEIWTRVSGYIRPITEFNIGKKQERIDRKNFKEQPINE
jgi:anaerobic ribonucleoside-triphosphate reductase